jgi:low affinity Fe/Cu permease
MMKKLLQNLVLPFALFSSGILLIGCEQATEPNQQDIRTETSEQNQSASTQNPDKAELKSGNMLYIVRDVADMQLKAGEYVTQLQETQNDLQTAIEQHDQQQLQEAATALQQQLTGFNNALNGLNLKTQEINDIREKLLSANQQVLASPFLNGQVDFSQVDFKKIQQQMGTIQSEMLKLASMMIPQQAENDSSNTNQS